MSFGIIMLLDVCDPFDLPSRRLMRDRDNVQLSGHQALLLPNPAHFVGLGRAGELRAHFVGLLRG